MTRKGRISHDRVEALEKRVEALEKELAGVRRQFEERRFPSFTEWEKAGSPFPKIDEKPAEYIAQFDRWPSNER